MEKINFECVDKKIQKSRSYPLDLKLGEELVTNILNQINMFMPDYEKLFNISYYDYIATYKSQVHIDEEFSIENDLQVYGIRYYFGASFEGPVRKKSALCCESSDCILYYDTSTNTYVVVFACLEENDNFTILNTEKDISIYSILYDCLGRNLGIDYTK